jgi:hypothetical protein
MSRKTIYHDSRLSVVTGDDHALGKFFQIFDKEMQDETPEGEGLVLDWSELFGFETNLTGISKQIDVELIIAQYIMEHGEDKTILN